MLAALGYLSYAGIAAGRSYYLSVDEFLANSEYHSHRLRVHGIVSREGLKVNPEDRRATFSLLGETGGRLSVEYDGAIPDLFKAGGEVVVVGRMGGSGVFQADELLTKCASKYDMKKMGAENPL